MAENDVHPRLQRRIAAVTAKRTEKLAVDRRNCIAALEYAIDELGALDGGPQSETIELLTCVYEWARAELKATDPENLRDAPQIAVVVRLLRRLSESHAATHGEPPSDDVPSQPKTPAA